MERPTCKSCEHFGSLNSVDTSPPSYCHRYPPVLVGVNTIRPISEPIPVYEYQYCGEHTDFPTYIASLKQDGKPNA